MLPIIAVPLAVKPLTLFLAGTAVGAILHHALTTPPIRQRLDEVDEVIRRARSLHHILTDHDV